jgi:hypothetical protein
MLGNRVTPTRLVDVINEHGVNFQLTSERRAEPKAAKAGDSVLDAIAKAKRH